MRRLAVLTVLVAGLALPASAGENLVAGLSQDSIEITSSYNGTSIVVFGALERPGDDARPDIVVVVRGPEDDMRVRRKSRVAGIWINSDRAILHAMPAYYFVASARPLGQIASTPTLRRYGLGLAAVQPRAVTATGDPEPFRKALIRHQLHAGLYTETASGVQFLSGTLFRVRVTLPAAAPRGKYVAEIYLLRDGAVVDARTSELSIDQTGLERRLFDFAQFDPLGYGVSTVLMAVLLGWLSSLAFRRME